MTGTVVYHHVDTGLSALVEVDEDGNYVAEVLELPGCLAEGRTLEEALGDLAVAIDAVLEVLREDERDRFESLTASRTRPALPAHASSTSDARLPGIAA